MDDFSQEDCNETHPGFDVICAACGSHKVIVENDMGHSAESGSWGAVSLLCLDCRATVDIAE